MIEANTVREWVEKAQKIKRLKGFLPEAIVRDTNIPRETVVTECMKLIDEGLLSIQYELVCPNCIDTLEISDNLEKLKGITECIYCGQEDIDESDVLVKFIIVR